MPLFHRHARGLILTEQGDLLFRTAREVFAKLAMTEAMLTESRTGRRAAQGHDDGAFGSAWLTPRIREFLDLYPEIEISLMSTIASSTCRCARPMSRSACRRRASPIWSSAI